MRDVGCGEQRQDRSYKGSCATSLSTLERGSKTMGWCTALSKLVASQCSLHDTAEAGASGPISARRNHSGSSSIKMIKGQSKLCCVYPEAMVGLTEISSCCVLYLYDVSIFCHFKDGSHAYPQQAYHSATAPVPSVRGTGGSPAPPF